MGDIIYVCILSNKKLTGFRFLVYKYCKNRDLGSYSIYSGMKAKSIMKLNNVSNIVLGTITMGSSSLLANPAFAAIVVSLNDGRVGTVNTTTGVFTANIISTTGGTVFDDVAYNLTGTILYGSSGNQIYTI